MNKPQGYDEAQSYTGDFEALKLGGHICKIIDAIEGTTQNGNGYLDILFDIEEGEQAGYYAKRFEEMNKNGQAKWQGTYRQFTGGNSTPYFKGMIENIEKSNLGYKFNFDEKTLIGKLFGGVFGREQYKNQQGEIKFVTKCRTIRTVETIREGVDIPEDKLLPQEQNNDFFSPIDDDSDLPF